MSRVPRLHPFVSFLLAFVSVVSLSSFLVSADEVDESDVTVLTKDNFETFINQEIALVEFYAPWCGHCKALTPEYAKAATELASVHPPVPLGKVDATVENALAGQYQVSGYPTLKIFRNGKASDYNGPRKHAGIVTYMKKQSGPAARSLSSDSELSSFVKSDKATKYAVVGFFSSAKVSQLSSVFSLLAPKLRDDFIFGRVTDNQELLDQYLVAAGGKAGQQQEAIIAFQNSQPILYAGADTKQKSVEDWIRSNSVPLVGELTEDNSELYSKRGLPLVKFFQRVDADWNSKNMKYYINRYTKLANEFKDRAVVVVADRTKFKDAVSTYNIDKEDVSLIVEKDGGSKKYRYEAEDDAKAGKVDVDGWKKWLDEVFAGNTKEYVRSERAPRKQGNVKIVTGNTFDEIVNDPSKDVLIEFYAPWCGHCKALEPKYNQLGDKLAGEDSIVIAKIDATANDFDRSKWEVSGYPTLYFRPAAKQGSNKLPSPSKYDGAREVDDMYKFVKKNARTLKDKKKKKTETD